MFGTLRRNLSKGHPDRRSLCFTGQERAGGRGQCMGGVGKETRDHSRVIWKARTTGPGVCGKWWSEDWVGLRSRKGLR